MERAIRRVMADRRERAAIRITCEYTERATRRRWRLDGRVQQDRIGRLYWRWRLDGRGRLRGRGRLDGEGD